VAVAVVAASAGLVAAAASAVVAAGRVGEIPAR